MWKGCVSKSGYGTIRKENNSFKTLRTHRLSWELTYGKIPENKLVCHKCDVKLCVNPEHLFVGTSKDNTQDMIRKGRSGLLRDSKTGRFYSKYKSI